MRGDGDQSDQAVKIVVNEVVKWCVPSWVYPSKNGE